MVWLCSLSLYYLSRFDCAPVVDHEFVIWVSLCSMVVIRWVFGFCRVGCDSVGFWVSLCSMALLRWFHHAQWRDMGFVVLDGVTVLSIRGFLGFAVLVMIRLWYEFFGFRHVLWCWVSWAVGCGLVNLQRWERQR